MWFKEAVFPTLYGLRPTTYSVFQLNPPFYRFPLTYSVNGLTVESHSLWFLFMRRWLGCGPPKEKPQAVAVRLQNWRNQTALWPICSATKTFMSIDVTKCVDWEVTLLKC